MYPEHRRSITAHRRAAFVLRCPVSVRPHYMADFGTLFGIPSHLCRCRCSNKYRFVSGEGRDLSVNLNAFSAIETQFVVANAVLSGVDE